MPTELICILGREGQAAERKIATDAAVGQDQMGVEHQHVARRNIEVFAAHTQTGTAREAEHTYISLDADILIGMLRALHTVDDGHAVVVEENAGSVFQILEIFYFHNGVIEFEGKEKK